MTPDDAQLYKGVNTASPPQHEKLLLGWMPPEPPPGYRNLVAILVPIRTESGRRSYLWVLDYLNTETAVFASEDQDIEVPWPWIEGFLPQADDWDSIGIPHMT